MDTSKKIAEKEVHGFACLPAFLILIGFVVAMIGLHYESVVPAVIGTLMLLGSVVSVESLTSFAERTEDKRQSHSASVVRHV